MSTNDSTEDAGADTRGRRKYIPRRQSGATAKPRRQSALAVRRARGEVGITRIVRGHERDGSF